MGFLRDMKNIRETTAEHGGMPSMKDVRRDISSTFDDRGEREILQTGIAAKGVVRGFTTPVPGDRFAMQIPIEVHPPDGLPYTIDYVFPTVRMQAAITAGMEIPIKIDRENPQRIAVQWDAQKASIAAAGGSQAAVLDGLATTYGGAANAAMEQAMKNLRDGTGGNMPPTTGAMDLQSRIERLDQLKSSGLIDEAQYATKKQKLLDEL
jgi:putative oligomerization/nucleic acid binding protein